MITKATLICAVLMVISANAAADTSGCQLYGDSYTEIDRSWGYRGLEEEKTDLQSLKLAYRCNRFISGHTEITEVQPELCIYRAKNKDGVNMVVISQAGGKTAETFTANTDKKLRTSPREDGFYARKSVFEESDKAISGRSKTNMDDSWVPDTFFSEFKFTKEDNILRFKETEVFLFAIRKTFTSLKLGCEPIN